MRQQRSQEARELIGSRVGAAKAIFTKHTSEGQLQCKYVKFSCLDLKLDYYVENLIILNYI